MVKLKICKYLSISLFIFLFTFSLFSQQTTYVIRGKTVDKNGQPVKDARVMIYGIESEHPIDGSVNTDVNGRFTLTRKVFNDKTQYVYVSYSNIAKNSWSLIDSPFFGINKLNRKFLGKPLKLENKTDIDLGDVPIQFWYGDVNIRIKTNGRKLTENEFLSLWVRLKDENGKIFIEQSIGPTIKPEQININESEYKISLPEGKWKIEFQKFDYDSSKIYPKILGQTHYFVVDKSKPQKIDISILPPT